jgi:sterol desaturase/sphingolipid hydroxylase (fatty acid hydroxylase superfamily)
LKDQLKSVLVEWLGPLYEPVYYAAQALFPFFSDNILNGVFVVSALVLALWFYLYATDRREPATARRFLRFLAPREVFLHRSALVDYRFYIVNTLFLSYVRLSVRVAGFVGLFQVAEFVQEGLGYVLGDGRPAAAPGLGAQIAFSIAMVLAVDFAKFFAHFLQHKVPLLWEFHKVHHSAEVLTPITNFRLHPMDVVLEQFLAAALIGLVAGAFGYWYPGQEIVELTILNFGAIVFVYFLAANLRHSHIPLHFGWRVSHVLSSPYMHQIHHSSEVRHWDRNYALIFSFWDALFGSLYVPRGREEFRLGLPGGENERFRSVTALYFAPFVGVFRRLMGRPASGATTT